jgi:two-component system, sensor histidine kinase and response regulator
VLLFKPVFSASPMSNLTSIVQGYYSLNTFQVLQDLWEQMRGIIGADARIVTNDDLNSIDMTAHHENRSNIPQFSLLQSPQFHALLIGLSIGKSSIEQIKVEITFVPTDIDRFLEPLILYLPSSVYLISDLGLDNDSSLQSKFTQLLLTAISRDCLNEREIYLQQQVTEAHLLNDISAQIHHTPDLAIVIQTAIDRVRAFLDVDRSIVYQLDLSQPKEIIEDSNLDLQEISGKVVYEALATPNLTSMLDLMPGEKYFADRQLWDKYQLGTAKAVDNVDLEYVSDRRMSDLMERYEIKSKLIVPIIVEQKLWGFSIVYQCKYFRQWEVRETEFLQKVAQHLSFAIHQSQLYIASQFHTQSLEQLVDERTRELRDAVIVAQTANQSKTEFLALLSHELRTPLTSILGLSATLMRLPSLNLTDRQQTYLQTIHNSGEHLSELIDDILDFYKLEVGKTFLKISEFSLSKLIKQIVEIVRPKAESGKIDLQFEIINNGHNVSRINGRDLRFRGDTKRIRQILLNILINAIKFTPEDGTVILRAWLEDRYAIFEIEDSGIGIEEEQIPRLFKKFHQLNPNYDRNYAGMGLGLAITQQLVELHGGWIDVDSIVGSGSTFTVRLASQPLQLPDLKDWNEMDRNLCLQDPELNPIPKRIILIEQDENIANFMCDILTAARYQVTWLLSADSSFRQISVLQPDLLIVDLAVGEQIVDRTIHNIRKSTTIGDTKILAIAFKDDILSPTVKECVDDYLWKQINPEQLLRKIAKLLSY